MRPRRRVPVRGHDAIWHAVEGHEASQLVRALLIGGAPGARPLRCRKPMMERSELRDPVFVGGLALLAVLSVLALLLYRNAPVSVEEARTRAWSSVRPGAFAPQIARARERLETGSAATSDSSAMAAYEQAREAAASAWELATGEEQTTAAVRLWAEATLGSAEVILRRGTAGALGVDDNELLREALRRAEEVIAAPVEPAIEQRAIELRTRTERQLRPGPLEWLPPWRS